MHNWIRMKAAHEAVIPASAEEAWELLTDFAGILRFWPQDGDSVIGISRVDLKGRHGDVPRTRHVHVPGGCATEILYKEDSERRRIYYDMNDDGIPGVYGYMATVAIDAIGPQACRMIFSSDFDVPHGSDVEYYRSRIERVYQSIEKGFQQYFSLPPDDRPSPTYLQP